LFLSLFSGPYDLIAVKFTLDQATNAQRGSRSIALLYLNLRARWRWVVNATPGTLYPRKGAGTYCIGRWVGPRVWTNAENLAPNGFDPVGSRDTDYAIPAHDLIAILAYVFYLQSSNIFSQPLYGMSG